MSNITIINKTNFFKRPLSLFALGDIKLKQPLPLIQIGVTLFLILFYTLPIIIIWGFTFNWWFAILVFAPPIIIGKISTKNIFGGRTLFGWAKVTYLYLQEPKIWCDLNGRNFPDVGNLYVEQETWISRRRELAQLWQSRK